MMLNGVIVARILNAWLLLLWMNIFIRLTWNAQPISEVRVLRSEFVEPCFISCNLLLINIVAHTYIYIRSKPCLPLSLVVLFLFCSFEFSLWGSFYCIPCTYIHTTKRLCWRTYLLIYQCANIPLCRPIVLPTYQRTI